MTIDTEKMREIVEAVARDASMEAGLWLLKLLEEVERLRDVEARAERLEAALRHIRDDDPANSHEWQQIAGHALTDNPTDTNHAKHISGAESDTKPEWREE